MINSEEVPFRRYEKGFPVRGKSPPFEIWREEYSNLLFSRTLTPLCPLGECVIPWEAALNPRKVHFGIPSSLFLFDGIESGGSGYATRYKWPWEGGLGPDRSTRLLPHAPTRPLLPQ